MRNAECEMRLRDTFTSWHLASGIWQLVAK